MRYVCPVTHPQSAVHLQAATSPGGVATMDHTVKSLRPVQRSVTGSFNTASRGAWFFRSCYYCPSASRKRRAKSWPGEVPKSLRAWRVRTRRRQLACSQTHT